jgi:preprotein translocase subunit Sec63
MPDLQRISAVLSRLLILVTFAALLFLFLANAANAADTERDPYEVLGIPRSASAEEIRAAYKKVC